MLTSSLVSLPPETVRQIAAAQSHPAPGGGGTALERGLALGVVVAVLIVGAVAAIVFH